MDTLLLINKIGEIYTIKKGEKATKSHTNMYNTKNQDKKCRGQQQQLNSIFLTPGLWLVVAGRPAAAGLLATRAADSDGSHSDTHDGQDQEEGTEQHNKQSLN